MLTKLEEIRSALGDRYILGNQNLTFAQLLAKLENITGLPAPKNTIPYPLTYGIAWLEENILARLGKNQPLP